MGLHQSSKIDEMAALKESEDRYRILADNSPEPIVVYMAGGDIVFINQAGAKLFASRTDQIIGKNVLEFVHPDYVMLAKSRIAQILCEKKPVELIEQKYVSLDGTIIDVEVIAVPITFIGKEAGLVLLRDITAKKQLEQVLRESDTRYRQIILNTPEPIIVHSDGICVFINIAGSNLLGLSTNDEVIGINFYDFIHPDCRSQAVSKVQEAIRGQKADFTEFKVVRMDRTIIDVEISNVSLVNYLGKPMVQTVVRDITERKRTEEFLRTSEKLSILGQLAAGIAHEIRNPLTSLKGFVQLLKYKNVEYSQFYEIMQSEIERINQIVSEFMVLAKPGPVNFQLKDVCLLVRQMITLLESEAALANVQIRTSFQSESVWISCVENQIKQVFLNVIKNAIEAMPEGGNIVVDIKVGRDSVVVRFSDTGVGISQDNILKLGEPFFTTKEKGTGLGLMVSYSIIVAHKGTINISSNIGEGTSVEVNLPLFNTEINAEAEE